MPTAKKSRGICLLFSHVSLLSNVPVSFLSLVAFSSHLRLLFRSDAERTISFRFLLGAISFCVASYSLSFAFSPRSRARLLLSILFSTRCKESRERNREEWGTRLKREQRENVLTRQRLDDLRFFIDFFMIDRVYVTFSHFCFLTFTIIKVKRSNESLSTDKNEKEIDRVLKN